MKLINFNKLVLGFMSTVLMTHSFAAVVCDENVSGVLIYGSGVVNIKHTGRNNWTVICSLKEEWKGVSVPTCAMWTSTLQIAKRNDSTFRFYYSDGAEYSSCADLPIYSAAPAPVYIGSL